MEQGEFWWADLPKPAGSEPGHRRPIVIVQGDAFNRSHIRTVVCVVVTSNLALANAPGNVLMPKGVTGLLRDSVANVSQVITLDRAFLTEKASLNSLKVRVLADVPNRGDAVGERLRTLTERVGRLPADLLEEILDGIELVLGRAR